MSHTLKRNKDLDQICCKLSAYKNFQFSSRNLVYCFESETLKLKDRKTLHKLLKNTKLFEILIEHELLTKEKLNFLLTNIDQQNEWNSLNENAVLLKAVMKNSLFDYSYLSERLSGTSSLYHLLRNKEIFRKLIDEQQFETEEAQQLLKSVRHSYEFDVLFKTNAYLLKFILKNDQLVQLLFNMFEEVSNASNEHADSGTAVDFFGYIEAFHTYSEHIDEEILALCEYWKYTFVFDQLSKEEKHELYDIAQYNVVAQYKLRQIVENQLEKTFENFESLMKYLTKQDKKCLLII